MSEVLREKIEEIKDNKEKLEYVLPEEKIYEIATNEDILDWKSFIYKLIYDENLNPWDIDISLLTKKYLEEIKKLKNVNFNLSGKFLIIAVFLLKLKSDRLVNQDIRGFTETIESLENEVTDINLLEEGLDYEELNNEKKKREYKIKFRNPLARKRKVTIFDLIDVLEKTINQTNKRRINYLEKKIATSDYKGPNLNKKKKKDIKKEIEELLEKILNFFEKVEIVSFNKIIEKENDVEKKISQFASLLYLVNDEVIEISQEKHLEEIKISKGKKIE